jgi:TPR repeat protein
MIRITLIRKALCSALLVAWSCSLFSASFEERTQPEYSRQYIGLGENLLGEMELPRLEVLSGAESLEAMDPEQPVIWAKKNFQEFSVEHVAGIAGQHFKNDSRKNKVLSAYYLARMHQFGLSDRSSLELAYSNMKLAADEGFSKAIYELGIYSVLGVGTEANINNAVSLFEESFRKGYTRGAWALGQIHEWGFTDLMGNELFPRDYRTARTWYEKGSQAGCGLCDHALGRWYRDGVSFEIDHKKANKWFVKAQQKNEAMGYFSHAEQYLSGSGVGRSGKRALVNLEKAVELGHAEAANRMGGLYFYGDHVDLDYSEAIYWYAKSVSLGSGHAAYNLGNVLNSGIASREEMVDKSIVIQLHGVQRDSEKVFKLFMMGSLRSIGESTNYVGVMYLAGMGINRDYKMARMYFELADRQGSLHAAANLGDVYLFGLGVEKDIGKAVNYYEVASDNGHKKATQTLGRLYEEGSDGLEKDGNKAIKYYRRNAKLGDRDSIIKLARYYRKTQKYQFVWGLLKKLDNDSEANVLMGIMAENGEGVTSDYGKAMKYYLTAYDLGSPAAANNIGALYGGGRGVKKDEAQAVYWYSLGADMGSNYARSNLGWLKLTAEVVERDIPGGLALLETAAENGHAHAMYLLGKVYRDGKDVDQDLEKSREYFELASEAGHKSAKKQLKKK